MSTPFLVIFDVDGTLVDSQAIIVATMNAAFETCGLQPPARARTLQTVGLSLRNVMEFLAPDESAATHAALETANRDGFVAARAAGQDAPLYPGARDCLMTLSAIPEVVLGVATGKARRGVDHSVERHDLHGLFTTIQTADTNPSKPHPAMVEAALSETGVAADRAVMIGDTTYDMDMGAAAGVATIGVSWGYHDRAQVANTADVMVDDFDALLRAIAQLRSVNP